VARLSSDYCIPANPPAFPVSAARLVPPRVGALFAALKRKSCLAPERVSCRRRCPPFQKWSLHYGDLFIDVRLSVRKGDVFLQPLSPYPLSDPPFFAPNMFPVLEGESSAFFVIFLLVSLINGTVMGRAFPLSASPPTCVIASYPPGGLPFFFTCSSPSSRPSYSPVSARLRQFFFNSSSTSLWLESPADSAKPHALFSLLPFLRGAPSFVASSSSSP